MFTIFCLFIFASAVMSQTKEYNVPGDYATVKDACDAIEADLVVDPPLVADAIINIAEGTIVELDRSRGWTMPVKVTLQGAGADKTFIESFRGGRPIAGEPDALSIRFMELTKDVANVEIIIKDITFRYFGRGDNDNGGMFSTSSSAGENLKVSLINCVIDSCVAKQGAIFHGANATHEFFMENCLVTACLAYGGSAYSGMVAIGNGGKVTIKNCTFMNNEGNPWDHRADPSNPIDVGAGRGGVISLKDGTNSMVDPPVYSPLIFVMENTAIINNLVIPTSLDSTYAAVHINTKDTVAVEVTLTNNIIMENRRTGYPDDVDMLISGTTNITLTNSGNILNRVVTKTETSYDDIAVDGCKIFPGYTYTHADINFTMDGDLPKLTPDEFGIGHVDYTGDGGDLGTVMVTAITLTSAAATVDPGSTLQINLSIAPEDATNPAVAWTVEPGTGSATIDNSGLLTPVTSGTVTVKATAKDGSGVSGTLAITITGTVGISADQNMSIRVFPNPSSGVFEINMSSEVKQMSYEVYSVTGNLVKSGIISRDKSYINMTDSAKGLYILRISNDDQSSTKRLVVR